MFRAFSVVALAAAAFAAPASASHTSHLSNTIKVDQPASIREQAASNPAGPILITATVTCDGFVHHTQFIQPSFAIRTLRIPAGAQFCSARVTATGHGSMALRLKAATRPAPQPPHLTL